MTWRAHIDSLIGKLRPVIACISKLGRAATRRVALQAYYALFESHLRYGIMAYGSAFHSILTPIERLQNCWIRMLSKKSRCASAEQLYDELGILPFRKLYLSVLLKQLHTRQPHIILNLEKDNALSHAYTTRGHDAGHLRPPASRLERTKKFFTTQYVSVYNSLPNSLKTWSKFKISKRKKNIDMYIKSLTLNDVESLLS